MRVKPYGAQQTGEDPPHPSGIVFRPFRAVPLGHTQEMRIDISESLHGRAVSARFFRSKGRGRPMEPGRPMHLFPEYLPALIEALTEAAAEIDPPQPENPDAEQA